MTSDTVPCPNCGEPMQQRDYRVGREAYTELVCLYCGQSWPDR